MESDRSSSVLGFTVLGRGLEGESVSAFIDAAEQHVRAVEAAATVTEALAEAAELREHATEAAARIVLEGAVTAARVHRDALATVRSIQADLRTATLFASRLAEPLADRTDDIHFTIDAEALEAIPSS